MEITRASATYCVLSAVAVNAIVTLGCALLLSLEFERSYPSRRANLRHLPAISQTAASSYFYLLPLSAAGVTGSAAVVLIGFRNSALRVIQFVGAVAIISALILMWTLLVIYLTNQNLVAGFR